MKSLINIPLLMEQLKRFWAISAILLVVYLLFGSLPLYGVSSDNPQRAFILASNMADLLRMNHFMPAIVMVLSPFAAVMFLYPYHFSNNASTAFYSFPINKSQLFFTNIVAALILMLLPLLIFCFTILVPVHYPGYREVLNWDGSFAVMPSNVMLPSTIFVNLLMEGDVINTIPVVIGFFARVTLGIIFYYSVFLLAASVAGNRVVAVLLSGAIPLIPIAVHMLSRFVATLYLFGFENLGRDTNLTRTLALTNPAMWGAIINQHGTRRFRLIHFPGLGESSIWMYVLSYIVIAVILFAIAFACCQKRKLERTEDSVVFTPLKNVCVFLVAMAGMIIMGVVLVQMISSRTSLYAGFVVGFILAYFIGQMIAEKSIDIRHKIKALLPYGGIMAGLYLIMIFMTTYGLGFYINRVPRVSEVVGVSINHDVRWAQTQGQTHMFTDDQVAIALVLEAHQQIIQNRSYLQRLNWQRQMGQWEGLETLPITYLLRDGTTMQRDYVVSTDYVFRSLIWDIRNNPSIILSRYVFMRYPYTIDEVWISFWDIEDDEQVNVEAIVENNFESLFAAIREDYVESRTQMLSEWLYFSLSQQIGPRIINVDRTSSMNVRVHVSPDYHQEFWHGSWGLHSSGENPRTREWLRARGYLDES